MLVETGAGPLESLSIGELRMRADLCDSVAREARDNGDPRWEEPARQHRVITAVLVRKIKQERVARGIPEPPPVVVGLEPVYLRAKRVR